MNIAGSCGVKHENIKYLDLIELTCNEPNIVLDCDANEKINDVSFMTNLKKLFAEGSCGINPQGIKGLNLSVLDTWGNPNFEI